MRYKGKVYRPPSEAYSLIVQVTYGCSHNRCAFCDMYDDKHFAMRPMDEIREDFELARQVYRRVERVFLADGDALMRRTGDLVEILGLVYGLFPECQRVTCYASPTSLQIKSEDELRLLRSKGLQMVYMGLESGCDAVLDGLDNIESRRILAGACARAGIPYIYGAVNGWVAQAAISMPGDGLVEKLYPEGAALKNKSVLSFTPALCAAMQVSLCVKLLVDRPVETGRIYYFDLLAQEFETIPMA